MYAVANFQMATVLAGFFVLGEQPAVAATPAMTPRVRAIVAMLAEQIAATPARAMTTPTIAQADWRAWATSAAAPISATTPRAPGTPTAPAMTIHALAMANVVTPAAAPHPRRPPTTAAT